MVWVVLDLCVELTQLVFIDQGMIKFQHLKGLIRYYNVLLASHLCEACGFRQDVDIFHGLVYV